jgi:phosphate transport system substrate-binding protein
MKYVLSFLLTLVILITATVDGTAKEQELIGAGATFPYPLYSKMFDVYSKEYGVKVNYQAIGSGGGIRQLTNKTVDFSIYRPVRGRSF